LIEDDAARLRCAIATHVPEFPRDFAQVRLIGLNGEAEVVWATVAGSHFKIQGFPLRVDGISRNDIVEAKPVKLDGYGMVGTAGVFEFVRVHVSSGNRTLRVLFDSPLQEADPRIDLLDHLSTWHCDFGGNEHRFTVSIRPDQNIDQVCGYLDSCGFTWECVNPAGE